MGFVLIEEWVDEDNPHKFYTMPVSAGTFATKEEAEEEKKQHQPQPQHVDGYIRVREELRDNPAPKRKKKGQKETATRSEMIRKSQKAGCGVYVFRRKGHIVYVGRGDSNFLTRVIRSHRSGTMRYDRKVQIYRCSCPREAYRLECTLIHRYEPVDNSIHPAVPAGSNWRCPVKSCDWS